MRFHRGTTQILQTIFLSALFLAILAPPAGAQCGLQLPVINLTSSIQTAQFGVPITFTVTVASAGTPPQAVPGISVTLLDSGVPIDGGSTDQNGAISFIEWLDAGTHLISASL